MYNVYLDITNYCNLSCVFCPRNSDKVDSMTPEDFDQIMKNSKGIMKTLTIGCSWECSLSPYFTEIMAVIKRNNVRFTNMYTHGNNLSEEKINAFIYADLENLVISLGESKSETYEKMRKGGKFDVVVSTIKGIKERKDRENLKGLRLNVNLTLLRSTLFELDEFLDLAYDIGIECITGRHMILMEGISVKNEEIVEKDEADEIILHAREKAQQYGIHFDIPLFSEQMPQKSCASMVYINSYGDVSQCPRIHMYEKFGNAITTDLQAIMVSQKAVQFKEFFFSQQFNNPVCGICIKNLETTVPINQGF